MMEIPFYVVCSEGTDPQTVYNAISDGDWYLSRMAALGCMDYLNDLYDYCGTGNKSVVYGGTLSLITEME